MPSNEYFIYLIESLQKTKEGFSSGPQDLVISNTGEDIFSKEIIGKIIIGNQASLIFKDRRYFSFIERITKIFSIQNFNISVNEELEGSFIKVEQKPSIEEPSSEEQVDSPQTARILKKGLHEVFVCPHLESKNSSFEDRMMDPGHLVKGMDWNDAYNCLFPDKECPLKQMCMNNDFSLALSKYTNFNNYDLYSLEFVNHGKTYNLAISKSQMAVIPEEES